jgi:hypothetical protein
VAVTDGQPSGLFEGFYERRAGSGTWYRTSNEPGPSYRPAKCEHPKCGKPFMARRVARGVVARFCSRRCSNTAPARAAHRHRHAYAASPLIATDIPIIRADSRPRRRIADDWGVSLDTINRIKTGKSWQHVK